MLLHQNHVHVQLFRQLVRRHPAVRVSDRRSEPLEVGVLVEHLGLHRDNARRVRLHHEALGGLVQLLARDVEVVRRNQVRSPRAVIHAIQVDQADDSAKLVDDCVQKLFDLQSQGLVVHLLARGVLAHLSREI